MHATNHTETEDYWYSSTLCQICHEKYPCDEIYFQKNTDIPIRRTQVLDISCSSERETTVYKVISIGKPDDRLFNTIPKSWAYDCQDVTLGVRYNPQLSKIGLKKSATVEVAWIVQSGSQNDLYSIRLIMIKDKSL
ncbi:unnamed protein product [Rotaria sp. Silwood2]|nr:unnamed protein product [Rotaria sp. Silwood2]